MADDLKPRCRFHNISHPAHMLQHMLYLQTNSVLCDVKVRTKEGEEIALHKTMLYVASDHFKSLLTTPDIDLAQPLSVDMASETFKFIVKYIYSGRLSLAAEELLDVYRGARLLQMDELCRWCMQQMTSAMTPETCVEWINFAEEGHHELLYDACKFYLAEHFGEVCHRLKELSFSTVEAVLEIGYLRCMSELQVYDAVRAWSENNPEQQLRVTQLLEHVRFELLPLADTKAVLADTCMQETDNADLARRALQYHSGTELERLAAGGNQTTPRRPPCLLRIGGKAARNDVVDDVGVWDLASERARGRVCALPAGRFGAYAAVVNNSVFFLGGSDRRGFKDSVFCFNVLRNTWSTVATLPKKCGFGVAFVVEDQLYVAGGRSDTATLKAVYRYTPAANSWTVMSDLPYYIYYSAADVAEGIGYISGGMRPTGPCQDIIKYDHVLDKWVRSGRMLCARTTHCMSAHEGKLYICGGTDAKKLLDTAEVFDIHTSQSSSLVALPYNRAYTSSVCFDKRIYIASGSGMSKSNQSKDGRVASVLVYDIPRGTWRECSEEVDDGDGVWHCNCVLVSLP